MIPAFDTCLVCDQIREERNGKLILLGFLGICPNVDVGVPYLDQPIVLSFLLNGGSGVGEFRLSFDILEEGSSRVVAAAAPSSFSANPSGRTSLAATLLAVFGHSGLFAFRCIVDGKEWYRASFRVSHMKSPGQ